jgi:diguanylate cyclase (GGDEF)-like protein
MNLDLHTLGIIGIAVGVAISLSFTLLLMVLRGLPALRIWATSFWVLIAGAIAQGLDESGTPLSAIVGNGLIATANALMLMGIAVHVRYPLRWRWPLTYVALYVALQTALMLARPPPGIEAIVFGAHSVIWDAWMVWVLLWRSPRDLRNTCRFTASVFVVDTLFYAARSAVVVFPALGADVQLGALLTTSNYVFGILCTFLLSTGFGLMLAQRLTLDLRRMARTDGLTGLLNRMAVMEEGRRLAERCRQRMQPCCLLVFDLDRFKDINDRWGHAAGDAVLKHFTVVVCSVGLPKDAVFARYGGEEFVLVLPSVTPGLAARLAEEMRERVAQRPAQFDGKSISFTTSVGLTATAIDTSFEAMVMAADAALYCAKDRGRNCIQWDYERELTADGDALRS